MSVDVSDGKRLLTFKQIAELAGPDITWRQVKRWADEEKIEVVRLPKERRITLEAWLEFIADRTEPARPEAASEERKAQFHRAAEARRIGQPYSTTKTTKRRTKAA